MKKCAALVLTSLVFAGWMRAASPAMPTIPATVFNITNYGAMGDGVQDNTTNIQNAIEAASAAGGGVVEVPEGRFLSGPITLRSSIHLQVDAGGTLQMLPFGKYPGGTTGAQTFIGCDDIHDLEISGPGTIDGQGAEWWAAFLSRTNSRLVRPMMLNLFSVNRLFIHDITFQNPPYHHCGLRGHGGNITISNLTVETRSPSPNTDGLNFVGTNSIIENCHISVGDDNIAMGSTGPIYDLLVTNCVFGKGHGVSIGSGIVGITNLTVANCSFTGTQSGIRIKCPMGRGGPVKDLNYVDLRMTNVNLPIVIYSYYNRVGTPRRVTPEDVLATNNILAVSAGTPVWRDITFSNVTAVDGHDIEGIIWGPTEMPVSNVTFVCVTNSAPGGFDFYNVRGVKIVDSQFNLTPNDTFTLCNADVSISNSMAPNGPVYISAARGSNALALSSVTAFMRGNLSTINPLTLYGGVLSTEGDQVLSGSSVENFVLGRAESKVLVGGNLTLNGRINLSAGSDFGPGTYDLFQYRGTLSGQPTVNAMLFAFLDGWAACQCSLDTNTVGKVKSVIKCVTVN
ncbi:MAG TPA: glycosyl hydrolase family 28 protein [Verrucomicrobiae bacterium]|nr:glycosyl hydrolase family 28 protein [Verrucomicrobiae bacterium]